MVQKNKVDDYYSQLDSAKSNEKDGDVTKKPKIVAKKKIVVKKATPKVVKKDDIKANSKQPVVVKKDSSFNSDKKPTKKPFVQKIEVHKKSDRKPVVNRVWDKNHSWTNRVSNWNRSSNWARPANWTRSTTPRNNQNSSTNSTTTSTSEFKTRWASTTSTAKFTNNKAPARSSNFKKEDDRNKKSKLAPSDKRTRGRFRYGWEDKQAFTRSNKMQKFKKEEKNVEDIKQNLTERKGETVIIWDFLSLKELSEKIWVALPKLMAEFMKNWMMVNINSKIDFDSASIVAEAFEIKLDRDNSSWANVEDIVTWDISSFLADEDSSKLIPRSPVISIMWHVDHWKTSLLDHIRKAKIASWEAGWITQSIWAYQVELEQGRITFLDTPWHEAFTIMRARWAKSTDIAILVVAADEWVKPQTIESINHAKEAGIPVIVAINKMDKEWANPDHVKGQLSEHGLTPEDWGGDTPMVPVSAHSGFWIDDLLEIILLVSEMQELKANPDRNWIATVIESHLDTNLWPVATVLINTWTVNSGDNIVCQDSYWKIKILKNYVNQKVKLAKPGEPVLIVWLDKVVEGWDILQVVNSADIAKEKAIEYKMILDKQKKAWASGLDLLMSKIRAWNLKQLKIILKADTNWSLEAMKASLLKLSTEETTVSVIHGWVGSITEWDILMGQWSEAILVWFNVWVLPTAKWTLDSAGVEYISSDIIYHVTERIEKIITWMLDPKEVEIVLWRSKVWGIFFTEKKFMILWMKVPEWATIENNTDVRVIRKKKMVWHGKIESLKQWTLEVKEVEWPVECWIKFVWWVRIEEWDELEIYKTEIHK